MFQDSVEHHPIINSGQMYLPPKQPARKSSAMMEYLQVLSIRLGNSGLFLHGQRDNLWCPEMAVGLSNNLC